MDEELDYVSSSPLLMTAATPPKPRDELDLPTLKKVQTMLQEQIASYSSIDRLTVEEKDLSVQQQLAVNKAVVSHLIEVKLLVDTVILSIKEKYNA